MTVKTGSAWAGTFVTLDATGALATPSTGPAGTLYVDGTADAATVTITGSNPYKWSVTLPSLTAGQRVDMYITATISTIATAGLVASEQADTVRLSDGVVVNSGTVTNLTNLPTMPTDWVTAAGLKADAVTEIQSGLATAAALATAQADLDNPDQYKADVSGIPAAVWGYATRTLSSFGSLIADIWSHVTRTLSSFGFTVATNSDANVTAIKAKTDNLPVNTATALAAIQSDLDNPAQYKADVSGLATTAHVQEVENKVDAIDVTVNTIPTNPLLDTAYTAPDNAGIAAIQEKTEQLTFTAPNRVDANADVVLSPEAIEGMATAVRDGLPEDIWSSSIRTLTQSPAEIVATVLGADITQIRGDSWAVQLTGVELGSIQQLAIKHSAKQSDSAALLFVDSVNGLTVLNGVAQDGEDSSKASLTYDSTILTLTVDASITAQLPAGSLQYGVQSISNNGIVSEPYGGTFRVLADIVRATD